MEFKSEKSDVPITEQAFADAAEDLDCDVAAIKAVAEVESAGGGFLSDGRPKILFERHWFRRLTKGQFNSTNPNISGPWDKNEYKGGAGEYDRLDEALQLDREAALQSASWGKFQIMGFNYGTCGYSNVEDFVESMVESEDGHLEAFIGFVERNGLDKHLRSLNWNKFAFGYNGPKYRQNNYHIKMARAYEKYSSMPQPELSTGPGNRASTTSFQVRSVRDVQTALDYLGISPGVIDNKMGPNTSAAIKRFQRFTQLPETGHIDVGVKAAVQAAYYMMKKFDALAETNG